MLQAANRQSGAFWSACSSRGPLRGVNADAFATRAGSGWYALAVADGVSSLPESPVAAQVAASAAVEWMADRDTSESDTLDSWGRRLLQIANDAVRVEVAARGLRGATTLAAVHVRGDRAAVATAGDTGVYLVDDGDAGARLLTTPDHVPAAPHMLLQWLDGTSVVEPHVLGLDRPEGWLLLLSDGVSGVIGPETLADVTRTRPVAAVADALVALARERESSDDATALVLRLPSSGATR